MSKFNFYPRPPRGGRLGRSLRFHRPHTISIHALREEGDISPFYFVGVSWLFLSTPSARRATAGKIHIIGLFFISIHALREEGDCCTYHRGSCYRVFLSTPSARRATRRHPHPTGESGISIHALREEGDRVRCLRGSVRLSFLSTPSARRATAHSCPVCGRKTNFYPRPPRGGRLSILPANHRMKIFLSTPSARRATECPTGAASRVENFYPRPPRGGRRFQPSWLPPVPYFYPRPPRGGRLLRAIRPCSHFKFLSTPSARRATEDSTTTA